MKKLNIKSVIAGSVIALVFIIEFYPLEAYPQNFVDSDPILSNTQISDVEAAKVDFEIQEKLDELKTVSGVNFNNNIKREIEMDSELYDFQIENKNLFNFESNFFLKNTKYSWIIMN